MPTPFAPARRPARAGALALLAVLAAAVSACGGGGAPSASSGAGAGAHLPAYAVTTRSLGSLGTVLVDGRGRTLYMFEPDHRSRSTCYSLCANEWPPLVLPHGVTRPVAAGGAHASMLGTTTRRDGSVEVTYHGWPLYWFTYDEHPGDATGQAMDSLGGLWYVLAPSGQVVRTQT